jgi:hypothetical protein
VSLRLPTILGPSACQNTGQAHAVFCKER